MSIVADVTPPGDVPSAVPRGRSWRGPLGRAALPALSVLAFFAAWQLAAASEIWNQTFVPFPSTVWRAFVDVSTVHDGARGYAGYLLWEHLYMTLRRVLAGVLIGVALGVALGLVMGSVGWVRRILEPWLTFLRALPPLAYFFLLVIWLGIDEAPITVLTTSRQLADQGKPTMDLAAVSNAFAKANPKVVDVWRQQQARALTVIASDPAAAAESVAAEVGLSADDVARQLTKAVFLTPAQVASPEWLGSEGEPGNLAANLESASQFLADQQQISAPAPLSVFQSALYTQGLPDVITR